MSATSPPIAARRSPSPRRRSSGIAIVGVHNSYYSGRNAYYVEQIARAGLVAIHTASAKPHVVPPGGRKPALGTNPFSIGFPSANGPVIYDIGTASVMWGEVLLMARLGQALPEGVGFDADGQPTRDARAVRHGGVAPFGGHKGYGLSFAIQALGLLAGAALPRGDVQDYGFLFIAIDPAVMLPEGDFARRWRSLSRASRRRRGSLGSMKSASPRSAHSANANSAASKASCWIAKSSMHCMDC